MDDKKLLMFEDREHIRRIGRRIVERWMEIDPDGVEKEIQTAAEFIASAFPAEVPALNFWLMEGLRNVSPFTTPVVNLEQRVMLAVRELDSESQNSDPYKGHEFLYI